MNILITGSNGQLGSEMREHSQGSADTYIFTDIAELNISDRVAVSNFVQEHKISVVVNCAAYTNVDKAEDDVAMAEIVNRDAVHNLAQACKENHAALIQISTDYVFSGEKNTPYLESDTPSPIGVYGRTKLEGEQAVMQSGCDYVIIRTSWLYSTYGSNFVKTMQRLTAERETLNVVFDQIGTPTYAADLAKTIIHIIDTKYYKDRGQIFHFSNEGVCSWFDFAVEIAKFSGHHNCNVLPCHSDEFPSKVTRPKYSVLDKTLIKKSCEVEIPHWRDALSRYFNKVNC